MLFQCLRFSRKIEWTVGLSRCVFVVGWRWCCMLLVSFVRFFFFLHRCYSIIQLLFVHIYIVPIVDLSHSHFAEPWYFLGCPFFLVLAKIYTENKNIVWNNTRCSLFLLTCSSIIVLGAGVFFSAQILHPTHNSRIYFCLFFFVCFSFGIRWHCVHKRCENTGKLLTARWRMDLE